jgi:hypothetical protein
MRRHLGFALIWIAAGCSLPETRHNIDYSKPTALGPNLTYTYICGPEKSKKKDPFKTASGSSTDATPGKCPDSYFKAAYQSETDASKQKVIRNRIIYELITVIDDDYAVYEIQIRLDRSWKDIVVSVVSIGLTGTATLAGKGAANTLAAVDTGIKGANAAVDTNLMRDKSTEILLNAMRANRAKVLQDIYAKLDSGTDKYPLEAAMSDLVRYYNEGSLTAALTSLATETAADSKKQIEAAETKKGAAQNPAK